MERTKQQSGDYEDERIPLGTFSLTVPPSKSHNASESGDQSTDLPEPVPDFVELEAAPDEASFHDVVPDNLTEIDYEAPSGEYPTTNLLDARRTPRGRVATLVGVPAAPAELLEMARAQRGSYPSPPSYGQVKQTLESLSGAASPAPIRPSKIPTVAPPRNPNPANLGPVSALDLDSPFETYSTPERDVLTSTSTSMAAPDVSGLLQEFAEQISDGRLNQTDAPQTGENLAEQATASNGSTGAHAPPANLSHLHTDELRLGTCPTPPLSTDEEVTPVHTLPVATLRPTRDSTKAALTSGSGPLPVRTSIPGVAKSGPSELTPFAVDSLAPREQTSTGQLRPASARVRGATLAAVAAVFLLGGFAASYASFAPAGIANNPSAGMRPDVGASAVRPASQVAQDVPAIGSHPAPRTAVSPTLIPAPAKKSQSPLSKASWRPPSLKRTPTAKPKGTTSISRSRSPSGELSTPKAAVASQRPVEVTRQPPVLRIRPVGPAAASQAAESRQVSSALAQLPKRQDVHDAMRSVQDQVRACAGHRTGTAQITATAVGSGRLNHVLVRGDFSGTPEGSCIARVVRTARLPPFSQRQFEFSYPFSM